MFDRDVLFPMLRKVHDVIRKNAPEAIYFFEPAQFPDTIPLFGGLVSPVGFPETPGGPENAKYESLNDHTYCCQMDADICHFGEPPLEAKDKCKGFHLKKVGVRAEDAKRMKVPLIFSEFGACSNSESCFNEITAAAEAYDSQLASWMYWMFKGFGDFTTTGGLIQGYYDGAGKLQEWKVLALQRSFVYAFQGKPLSMKFITDELNNGTMVAKFTLDTSINAPSEIYLSESVYYPNGFKLSILIDNQIVSEYIDVDHSTKNYLKFIITDDKYHGKIVSIVLT